MSNRSPVELQDLEEEELSILARAAEILNR